MDEYASDLEAVIERAKRNQVRQMIVAGIDAQTSLQAIHLAELYEGISVAVGLHPNSRVANVEIELNAIHKLTIHPKVVAIGEIGLDYYRDDVSVGDQQYRLQTQLSFAAERQLPVIIHNRNAFHDIYPLVCEWVKQRQAGHPLPDARLGVFHSFSEDSFAAQKVVELGFFLGVSGVITFPNARKIVEVVRSVRLESLLIETDAPYLCPQPCRGKRNEPANLIYTLQKLAEVLEAAQEKVASATTQNAQILFGIG